MIRNKKIGIITQARMTSTRLPGKILLQAGGKPMLEYHIKRAADSGYLVITATTTNGTDDVIADWCRTHSVPFYRGSEDDVLDRYYKAAIAFGLGIIVRVTSDCPLLDGKIIKEAVEEYLGWDDPEIYLSNGIQRTFPRGFDFEVFSMELLERAYLNAAEKYEREHVTPFLYHNVNSGCQVRQYLRQENKSIYRLTLDTQDDFRLLKTLIEDYKAHELSCNEVIAIMDRYPQLHEINSHIEQKKLQ